jgi:hypothetical protein
MTNCAYICTALSNNTFNTSRSHPSEIKIVAKPPSNPYSYITIYVYFDSSCCKRIDDQRRRSMRSRRRAPCALPAFPFAADGRHDGQPVVSFGDGVSPVAQGGIKICPQALPLPLPLSMSSPATAVGGDREHDGHPVSESRTGETPSAQGAMSPQSVGSSRSGKHDGHPVTVSRTGETPSAQGAMSPQSVGRCRR